MRRVEEEPEVWEQRLAGNGMDDDTPGEEQLGTIIEIPTQDE